MLKECAVRRVDHIFCNSENTRRDLLDIHSVAEDRVTVTYLGYDALPLSELMATDWAGVAPYLLQVGGRHGHKNFENLRRDFGINPLWADRYCQSLLARGFEHKGEPAALVTAFEAFEHFVKPAEELDRMLAIAPNVLFSTEMIANPAPIQDDWCYYRKDHGQHIGFF